MFNPSRDQARAFLFDTWEKHRAGTPLTGLEKTTLAILIDRPLVHDQKRWGRLLSDVNADKAGSHGSTLAPFCRFRFLLIRRRLR